MASRDIKIKKYKRYFLFATILFAIPILSSFYSGHTGKLLIAREGLPKESPFHQAVIYIFHHSIWGATGIILNGTPMDPKNVDHDFRSVCPEVRFGGPVKYPTLYFLMADQKRAINLWRDQPMTVMPLDHKAPDDETLTCTDIGILYSGYAGWSPGQLEQEITNNVWSVKVVPKRLFVDKGFENMWISLQSEKK